MSEQERQEGIEWRRGESSLWYKILGRLQVQAAIEASAPGSFLDVGCGDGYLTSWLSQGTGARIVGIDASAVHIDLARSFTSPRNEYVVSLLEDFDSDEEFDNVTMFCVLEHVIDPVETLKQAASHLRASGRLIVQVPNAVGASRRIGMLMGLLEDCHKLSNWDIEVAGHRRYYDVPTLAADFETAGLYIISIMGVFYKMLSTPQMEWLLDQPQWDAGEFGWGDEGNEDWRWEFCRACYEFGRGWPEKCNIIQMVGVR